MYCFSAITGTLMAASVHGRTLSILFARAISMAAAEYGFMKSFFCNCSPFSTPEPTIGARSEGVRRGEEKESRYKAMKNSSLSAQTVKRTR